MHTNRVADRKNHLANMLRIKYMIPQMNKNLGGSFWEQEERDLGSWAGGSGEPGAGGWWGAPVTADVGTGGVLGKVADAGRREADPTASAGSRCPSRRGLCLQGGENA